MRGDAFLPQAVIICMIVLVLSNVFVAQDSNETLSINNTSSEDFDHCKEFLSCENEMMAIHKRCTEQSRKATATACGLNQQFSDLSKLMDARISEFQGCVDDSGTASNSSTEVTPNAFDIPEECLKSTVLRKRPLVHPEMGCWRAVAMVRLHCQRLRKCCPAANICMKDLRNSEATKSLREKHIEINRKTLECRNQMRQVIMEKRNGTNSNLAVQAHAVLIAQKETPGGKIQQKYLSLLPKNSNRHFNPTLKHPKRTKLGKQIYAAPRAKPYPEANTPTTRQNPINVPKNVLASPPKLKSFESRETIDRTTNQGGHLSDVSVSNRLGEFEKMLRKMETSSPKGHSKARGVSQSGAAKRKAVRNQTLRHSMRPRPLSKLQRPVWRDVSSDGAKTSIDVGEKIIFQKKSAGQRRRRISRHFPQQVFPSLMNNEVQDNVFVNAPSQPSKPIENSETQLNRASEDYEADHAPMGIFGPISATTPPGAVPVMVSRTQPQSFALPAYVDLGKLKVFQARPIHKLTQSVSSGKRRTAINRRLMSSGRLNLLGKRVLPLKISNGNGLPNTGKEGRRRKQSKKQRGVVTGHSGKDNRLRKPIPIGSNLNLNGQGLEPISSAAIVNTPEIAMNLGHDEGGWTKAAPVAVPTSQLESTTTTPIRKAIGREPETAHLRSRMRSPAYKRAGFYVGVRRIFGESPEKSSKEEKLLVGLDGETGNRELENSQTTISSAGITTTTAESLATPEPVILPAWPSSNIVVPYAKFDAEADLAVEGHVSVVKGVNGVSQRIAEESHNIENTENIKSSFSADPFSTFAPTFSTQASPSIMLDENLLSHDAFTTPSPDTRRTISLIREWTAASTTDPPVDPNLHDHETMIPTPPSFMVEVDSDDTVDSDKQDLEALRSLPFLNEIRRSPVSTTRNILGNSATVSTTTPQMIVVDGSAEIQDQVGQDSETQTFPQDQSSTQVPVTNRLRQIKIAMAPVTQIPPVTWQDFDSTVGEMSANDLQQSTMQTEVTRKPNKVLDAVLARKQLQRILVPLGTSQSGNRVLGYRNKVLQARRQLIRKLNGTHSTSTAHMRQMSQENALTVSQRPKAGSLSLRVFKKEPLPQSSGDSVALSPNIDEPSADVESLQRTTVGVNLHFESDPLVTLPPTAEIRRSPARNNLPPPPVSTSDPFSDKAMSDTEEEMLLVKHNLVLNLEKFLDARKNEARKKLEEESERDRLEVLRKPKSEYDSRHQISGYCELYSTCSDQLKYVQNKCQQFPDESGSAGRLLPGLPKRRFGSCNARLLAVYQRVDVVHLELNENVENCLVEKIAIGAAKVSDSCPAEWPTLPLFESDANNCVQRVSIIQNHCKKLGHCCSSLESCRQSVDNSGLARRLRLEEERLKQRSAECQVQANEEYRKLRVLQQGTESTDKSAGENRGVDNVNKRDESPPSVVLSPFTDAFQQNVKTHLDTSNLDIPLQSPVTWPTSEQRRLRRRRDRNSRNRLRL